MAESKNTLSARIDDLEMAVASMEQLFDVISEKLKMARRDQDRLELRLEEAEAEIDELSGAQIIGEFVEPRNS